METKKYYVPTNRYPSYTAQIRALQTLVESESRGKVATYDDNGLTDGIEKNIQHREFTVHFR